MTAFVIDVNGSTIEIDGRQLAPREGLNRSWRPVLRQLRFVAVTTGNRALVACEVAT